MKFSERFLYDPNSFYRTFFYFSWKWNELRIGKLNIYWGKDPDNESF